jgi:effector-binding domain-containing protein
MSDDISADGAPPEEPRLVHRDLVRTAGITAETSMDRLAPDLLDAGRRLADALSRAGVPSIPPPIWRYREIDMPGRLVVTAAIAVPDDAVMPDDVEADVLPAGEYVVLEHTGHPDSLEGATGRVLAWGDEHGVVWDADGARWGSRIEEYLTDPDVEPDLDRWVTRIAIRVRTA